jgi:cyclopropane-fatty-acyl-phospholipid synthase
MKPMLEMIFRNWLCKGCLRIIDTKGNILTFGETAAPSKVTLRFHDAGLPLKLMGDFTLALGEAYMNEGFTIEEGTLYELLELLSINYQAFPQTTWFESIEQFFAPVLKKIQQYNPLSRARKNVAHHYDLSAQLYKLFLDKDMQYSCAYFRHPNDTLEVAQLEKKRHIAAKLLLRPGMRVLDIGCGWGGMALYLAQNYGVEVVGLTLSEEQLKIAVQRAAEAGMAHKVKFYLRDYREEIGEYDRIVSAGMFEHVGVNHYQEFFEKAKSLLKHDGVMLLHSIGRMEKPGTTNRWMQKYIFPGAYAPAISEVFPAIENNGLWSTDMEILRLHYAETLSHWRMRFYENRAEIAKIYDERFCRMWDFYLCGCEVHFRHITLMVFQIQVAKNIDAVPMLRDYMFEAEQRQQMQWGSQLSTQQLPGNVTELPLRFRADQFEEKDAKQRTANK